MRSRRDSQVESEQRVISTGLYAIVRHPMYACAVPLFLVSRLRSLVVGLVPPPPPRYVVCRLLDEERYLARNLPATRLPKSRAHTPHPGIW